MNARLPLSPPAAANAAARSSYRRGLWAIALLGLGLLSMLGLWARSSWNTELADAQTELQRLAVVNALPVALALRDGRRAAEAMDRALSTTATLQAPALARLLADELALRFHGQATADLLASGRTTVLASTAPDSFEPALLEPQWQRVTVVGNATLGWAYRRGDAWWLPLFFVREGGQVLVINLAVDALFSEWLAPGYPGENPVGLRAADGRLLLRMPFTPPMLGVVTRGATSSRLMDQQIAAGATSGAMRAVTTETDHVERLIGWARVPGTDLRVLALSSTDGVFAQWRAGTAPLFLGMAALIVLALGGAAMSLRRQHRLAALLADKLDDANAKVQAQARLAESEATLQRMCELARIGPWHADVASGTLTLSDIARDLYGLPADATLPAWHDFHPADDQVRERVQAVRDRLVRDGVGYDMVAPATLPDGSRRWLRSVAAAHCTEGRLDRVDGAVQDVTAQVLAQQALDEQSRRARMLAEAVGASTQLLLVTDAQEHITWCNDAFERRTGYTLDEIRGKQPGALLQRGQLPLATKALMRRHIQSCAAFSRVRVQNFSKRGEAYWVDLEVRPIFDEQGALECFIGLQTDVTHDIEREQALRDSAQRFELATAHAGMGVHEFDLERGTRTWSEGMYRLYGFDPADGLPSVEAVDARVLPEDGHLRRPAFARACEDRSVREWGAEFRIVRPDGSLAWLHSRWQIERDESGRAVRAVGTTLDITDARTVALERQARAEAEARSQAKTSFLSHMSHELRTPLHAVIGYAQLINSAPQPPPGVVAPYMERIETAGWHLLALIDNVLELALLEGEEVSVELEAVDLEGVVREAHGLVERDAEKACLLFDLSLQPVVAWANATRVRQVVVNLLSNAIKYNLAAGSVRIAVRADAGQACVEVADTGLGMTDAQLASLYEPFNRLGRENSGVEGTGIGLAITKRLVERMGGTLEVASRIDAGTTFRLRLPLATAPARASAPPAPVATGTAARVLDVLCIEDNEVNALLLRETLYRLRPDWPVRLAASGVEATQMLRDAPVDLVFLDLNLPDTQGLEWLAYARGAGLLHHAEVALLTADVLPQTRAAAEAAGLRHFLSKPFAMADLERLITQLAQANPAAQAEPVT